MDRLRLDFDIEVLSANERGYATLGLWIALDLALQRLAQNGLINELDVIRKQAIDVVIDTTTGTTGSAALLDLETATLAINAAVRSAKLKAKRAAQVAKANP